MPPWLSRQDCCGASWFRALSQGPGPGAVAEPGRAAAGGSPVTLGTAVHARGSRLASEELRLLVARANAPCPACLGGGLQGVGLNLIAGSSTPRPADPCPHSRTPARPSSSPSGHVPTPPTHSQRSRRERAESLFASAAWREARSSKCVAAPGG